MNDPPVRGDVHARVERQPDEVDGRRPGCVAVPDLRDRVHLDGAVRPPRCPRSPAPGRRPAWWRSGTSARRSWGQRRPGVRAVVVGARMVDAVAVGDVAARDEQAPVGQVGVSRAEQVDRRAVGALGLRGRGAGCRWPGPRRAGCRSARSSSPPGRLGDPRTAPCRRAAGGRGSRRSAGGTPDPIGPPRAASSRPPRSPGSGPGAATARAGRDRRRVIQDSSQCITPSWRNPGPPDRSATTHALRAEGL